MRRSHYLVIILLLIAQTSFGQIYQNMAQPGYKFSRARFDSVLTIPSGLGNLKNITGGQDTGQIRFNKSDSSVYVWNGRAWIKAGGGTIPTLTQVLESAVGANEAGANQIKDLSAGTADFDAVVFKQLKDTANLRLRISDTATMLSAYARSAAVTSSLALKLNISDTAAMLAPYSRVTVLSYGKNATADSTILLLSNGTRYAAKDSVGGGGGNIYTTDGTLNATTRTLSYNITAPSSYENKLILRNLTVTGGANNDFIFQASNSQVPTLQIWNPNYGGQLSFGGNGVVSFGGGRLNLSTSSHPVAIFPGGVETARFFTSGNLGIGTSTDAASAILNLTSTTKGVLFPRMTTTQRNAISSPATGLQIYNTTTNTNDFYNGTAWVSLASGNIYTADGSLTSARTLTLNSQPLTIAGTTSSRFFANGNFAIGTTTDSGYPLTVNGTTNIFRILSPNGNAQIQSTASNVVSFVSSVQLNAEGSSYGFFSGGLRTYIGVSSGGTVSSTVFGSTAAPDVSALVDIKSTTKGVLFPRMTTVQKLAIGTPAAGLQVYDTTLNQMSYYNGTTWVNF
jgi:hypothetical protein